MAKRKPQAMIPDGPLPAEHYTSDWRNYPWHRPPDIVHVDEALEYVARRMADTDEGLQYMSYLKAGVSIAGVTDMILTLGVADGKWSIDFAILIAGPVARLLTIMAKSYDVPYEMGIDRRADFVPSESIKTQLQLTEEDLAAAEEEMQEVVETAEADLAEGGLMAMAPQEEQNAMLGYGADDEDGEDAEPDMEEEQV